MMELLRITIPAGLLAGVLATSGCAATSTAQRGVGPTTRTRAAAAPTTTDPTDPTDPAFAESALRRRPTFEQAAAEYTAMLDEMRTAMSAITPTLRWVTPTSAQHGDAGCLGPYAEVPGNTLAVFTSGSANGAVPAADWAQIVQALTRIGAEHRFVHVRPFIDKPPLRIVQIWDDWGGYLEVGSEVNTTLDVNSGCFIDQNRLTPPITAP